MPSFATGLLLAELDQTLHRFFHHLDARDYGALVAAFAPDGRWLRQGRWLDGRRAILGALEARPASVETCHVITNAFVVDADTGATRAEVEALMTAYRYPAAPAGGDAQAPRIAGPLRVNRVTTRYARASVDADWLVAEQRLIPLFDFEERHAGA